MKVMKNLKI